MSAFFDVALEAIKRDTNLVPASGDYSFCFYVNFNPVSTSPAYQTAYFLTDDIVAQNEYIAVYVDSFAMTFWVSDGVTDEHVSLAPPADNKWHHVAYTRSGNTHRFYFDGVLVDVPITLDISGNTWATMRLGDDTASEPNLKIAYFREWDAALSAYQVSIEARSVTPLTTNDLWCDCPLNTDLLDDSGNNYDFTAIGTVTFAAQPSPLRWTAFGIGTNWRQSSVYTSNVMTPGADGAGLFYASVGTDLFSLTVLHPAASFDGFGVLTSSTRNMRLRYRGNDVDVTADFTNPVPDPMIGFETASRQANPRVNWPWYKVMVKCRTSTYDPNTGTYLQDGLIEVKIDSTVLYTASNIYIKRNRSLIAATFECWPGGDGDGLWVTGDAVYPTFAGAQNVPSSPYLVEYLNFNNQTAPGWSNDRIAPFGNTGPVYNLASGLDDTGGINAGDTDPNIWSAWNETAGGGSNGYGSIRKDVSLIVPDTDRGTIIVEKLTLPADDVTEFDFAAGGGLSPTTFTLKNGETQTFSDVVAGDGYSIEETIPAGWFMQAEVSNGSPLDNISVAADETVTILIINTTGGGGLFTVPTVPTIPSQTPPGPNTPSTKGSHRIFMGN